MTKKKKVLSYNQPSLFDVLQDTIQKTSSSLGAMNIAHQVKMALSEDLKHAVDEQGREISRAIVAARMTDEIGEEVTLSMLNNWTATSHPHDIPLKYFPAFIKATGMQRRAAEVISRYAGLFILPGPEAIRAEIRKRDEMIEAAKTEKREWVILLKKLEGK